MKDWFFKHIVAFMFLTCFWYRAAAQNIQAEARLQQYTIRIGDQTKLFLSVHQSAKQHVNFPKLTDTIANKVQVVGINKPDTAYDHNNHSSFTVTQSYTITSFDAGTYKIPQFLISSENGIAKTKELTLQVQTVKVDTAKAIYDIKQPIAVTYTFWDLLRDNWYWIVFPLLGVAALIGLVWYLRKRPKVKPVIKVVVPLVPPHVTAINKLKELEDKKLWQTGHVKQYHIELSDIAREYLEKRYAIKTHEKTTDEIFTGLKHKDVTDENSSRLRQILLLADLVKFAKEMPLAAENEQSMEVAIDFVTCTQQNTLASSPEGGKAHV